MDTNGNNETHYGHQKHRWRQIDLTGDKSRHINTNLPEGTQMEANASCWAQMGNNGHNNIDINGNNWTHLDKNKRPSLFNISELLNEYTAEFLFSRE